MATDETAVENELQEEGGVNSPFALLFELEYVAVSGRQAAFDVLSSILGEQQIALTPILFERHALQPPPSDYLEELLESLGAKKSSVDKLAEEVEGGTAMYYSSSEATLNAFADELLRKANTRGVAAAALTGLPQAAAQNLMERLGLAERGIRLFEFDADTHRFPRADVWLKAAKALGCSPRNCVAVVSSNGACRSALAAGMRCLAAPDAFTVFQDFSGADALAEPDAPPDLDELLELLFPPLPARA